MNINKVGYWIKDTNEIITIAHYIEVNWRKIFGYKTRGYNNRVHRVGKSRTIKANLNITKHVKRNRTYGLVLTPTNLREAE